MEEGFTMFIWFAFGLMVGFVVMGVVFVRLRLGHARELKQARAQSVKQSGRTLRGQIAEEMAPMLPGFDFEPADCKFLGDPVDYVIFDGLSRWRNGEGALEDLEIVFVDVKSGKARLNDAQRAIQGAIEAGRVRFATARVGDDFRVEMR